MEGDFSCHLMATVTIYWTVQSQGVPNILYWCLISGTPPRSEEVDINQILKYGFIYTVWKAATRIVFFSSFCFQISNFKVSRVVGLKLVGCRSPFYSLTHWASQIAIHIHWHNGKESTCSAGDSGDVSLIPWRRKWQPTPVFLRGKSHGWRRLVGYRPWGDKRVRHD